MKIDREGDLIALKKEDTVLLVLRDNKPDIVYPNLWGLPGGKREENETSKEAVVREFKEETGYILNNPQLIHTEIFERDEKTIKWNIYLEEYDNKQEINCYEGQKVEFMNLEQIEKLDLVPRINEILREVLK